MNIRLKFFVSRIIKINNTNVLRKPILKLNARVNRYEERKIEREREKRGDKFYFWIFTLVLQMVNFFLSPMQYFPLLAGCGLSHSRSAYFNPPPHVLLQLLIGPHFPQPPWTAAGRAPMSTHSLCMHH